MNSNSKFKVLLADDHVLVSEGICRLIEEKYEVAGRAQDGREVLAIAQAARPDIAVLDISMPGLNGIDTCRRLRQLLPDTRVLMLTMHADAVFVKEAFAAGATGYVLKRSAATELDRAIESVLAGEVYLSPGLERPVPAAQAPGRQAGLTDRQREVLQLVSEGQSAKQIAYALGISIKTVEFHKACIMKTLGVRTIAQLTRYALEHGIAGPVLPS